MIYSIIYYDNLLHINVMNIYIYHCLPWNEALIDIVVLNNKIASPHPPHGASSPPRSPWRCGGTHGRHHPARRRLHGEERHLREHRGAESAHPGGGHTPRHGPRRLEDHSSRVRGSSHHIAHLAPLWRFVTCLTFKFSFVFVLCVIFMFIVLSLFLSSAGRHATALRHPG